MSAVGAGAVERLARLAWALAEALRRVDPALELRILTGEPVAGAVVLARRMLGSAGAPSLTGV